MCCQAVHSHLFRYLQVDPTIELTVLEAESTLGGTWSSARVYPELLTQQPYGHYEAVDFPMEQRDPDAPAGFIPSKRVHSYLEEYAKTWNVSDKIRYNATVERVQRAEDGIAWQIDIKGSDTPLICDKLIVATGLTSRPNLPGIPASNFTPLVFHSRYLGEHHSALRSPDVSTITVYGGGKSAYDCANAAMKAGKKVNWVIRTSGEGVGMMIDARQLTRRVTDLAWTPAMSTLQMDPLNQGWIYRFFHSGRNALGYWLNWAFWGLASRKLVEQWDYDTNKNMAKLKPNFTDHT
jgi:dimethylaniline monooxygenase (N-oxide forming)